MAILKASLALLIAVGLFTSSLVTAKMQLKDMLSASQSVDRKGNISLPKDFKLNMVHLGSWFVPEGGASGFHDVYTDKAAVEYYRENGKFPDGAVIVKELRASKAADYTTGANVSHATKQLKQWFVMVKDSKDMYRGNASWGDGWGWALFKPGDKKNNVSSDYKVDCLTCHVPAKDTDWIYTEAYPVLSK